MKRNVFFSFLTVCMLALLGSCTKEYSIESGIVTLDAVGSLKDSIGDCMPATVTGTFYNGVTPGGDTAYVEVKVDVDSVGSYTITTDLQNGFMFADSGFFSTTGINIVRLKPIGTPILQKPTFFTVNFDTSICSFTVNVNDSTGTGLGGGGGTGGGNNSDSLGNWEFSTASGYFHGIVDTAVTGDTLGLTYLAIRGVTAGDSTLLVTVIFPGNTIVTGTYTTQGVLFSNAVFGFSDENDATIYFAVNDAGSASLMTINITSYNSTTRIVTGTFSGLANDMDGNAVVDISNGNFTATVLP
ncbi:MAG TPA: hypothetical protein PLA68_07265 [Panacibacter sp.]|nr:hypothetical protein [Panacibacter sp.]